MRRLTTAAAVCGVWLTGVVHDADAAEVLAMERTRKISQHGVTWTLDNEAPVGQFVNGDYYIVGPVTVVEIDPAPVDGRNGSILDHDSMRNKTGFDSRDNKGNCYDARLRSKPPIPLEPGDSLLSSISCGQRRQFTQMLWPFNPDKAKTKGWVRSVSVLTCVDAPQPSDAFRPAFCDRKNSIHLARNLRRELLHKLKPAEGTPPPDEFARHFQRCWVDVMQLNKAAPAEYAAQYGRETARAGGMATLILHCDFPDEDKEKLLVNFVQYGIDLYGALQAGWRGWGTLGGHGQGRKWPLVFAGIMLGNEAMARPDRTFPDVIFQEDDQTVYGKCWTGAGVCWAGHLGKSGWNLWPDRDRRGFFAESVHPSEWPDDGKGSKFSNPGRTAEMYRRQCTSHAWIATALSMRIMRAEQIWNHDPFGDYCDRWMTEDDSEHVKVLKEHIGVEFGSASVHGTTWDPWVTAMYEKYREKLPPTRGISFP